MNKKTANSILVYLKIIENGGSCGRQDEGGIHCKYCPFEIDTDNKYNDCYFSQKKINQNPFKYAEPKIMLKECKKRLTKYNSIDIFEAKLIGSVYEE